MMQDTTKMQFTPESLSRTLGKDYKSLQRTINRLGLSFAKEEALTEQALMVILQKEAEPHHAKDQSVVDAAARLLRQFPDFPKAVLYKQPVVSMQVQDADNDEDNTSAPDATDDKADNETATSDKADDKTTSDKPESQTTTTDNDNPKTDKETSPDNGDERSPVPSSQKPVTMATLWLRGIFVGGLVLIEAWIYASLSNQVFDKNFPFALLVVAGVLVESAGIFIADGMKIGAERTAYKNGARVTIRKNEQARINWLLVFFFFQFGIVSCFVGLWGETWSQAIAKVLIALSIPGAIGAYSHLFLTTKDN
jgi:hypothetical protein